MPRRAKARPDEGAAERRIVTSQFRDDLVITPSGANGGGGTTYLIEDPVARESFSFGEEEYFLCRSMNGTATAEEILDLFQKRFDAEMSLEHFHNFEEHLLSMGLARPAPPRIELPPAAEPPAGKEKPKPASSGGILGDPNPRWKLFNPSKIFDAMLRAVLPVRFLFILAVLALIPAFPASLFMIFRHSAEFQVELMSLSTSLGYFGGLLFSLLAANFIRCVVQGVVCAYYNLTPQAFGFKLRRGILPRFYIDKARIRASDRHTKLWIYGTSILIRLFFVVIGAGVWAMFKGNQTLIPSVAVTMAQAGMIGILLELLPLETTDGYRWMVNFFNWPPNMIFLAFRVGYMRLTFQPLPDTLKGWKGFRYLIYSIILVVGLSLGSIKIMEQISKGFMQAFPDLFGRATQYIIIAVFGFFVLRWALGKLMHRPTKGKAAARRDDDDEDDLDFDDEFGDKFDKPPGESASFREFFQRHRTLAVVLVLIALMFVPFAYRPGGEIQVLPPVQQQIQAPVTGRIAEVHFEGGDGKLIPRGTLVAKMISSDIENELLTLEQSKSQQLATIDKLKSELAKLQSGARSEEITSAEAKLQQAVEEMNVAAQELQSAKVSSDYSTMVLPRMEKLYKSGSLAELQYEEAKKGAQIDKINVEKASKNLASLTKARDEAQSQLNLVKSGSRPEDIDSARHSVEAAQAELSRIEQQITYNKQQQTESALLMPFEGYLVDSHLDFKKGIYLWKGEIFATAQNNSQPLVVVQLPEYDMEGVEVGAIAQVKLFAYPNSSLTGKVLSIQPAALASTTSPTATPVTESVTRMFQVLIEVDKPPFTLKGGMTGFAKINAGYQPLGLLLLRPVIRFVQIEMWSWLP